MLCAEIWFEVSLDNIRSMQIIFTTESDKEIILKNKYSSYKICDILSSLAYGHYNIFIDISI